MYSSAPLELLDWVPSATHCQFECQKRPLCQFFVHDSRFALCGLKSVKEPVDTGTPYATSGSKFCATKKGLLKMIFSKVIVCDTLSISFPLSG